MPPFVPIFLIAAGLFSVAASIGNWDFFFNNRRARMPVALFGRQGARVAYGILGAGLSGTGATFFIQQVSHNLS